MNYINLRLNILEKSKLWYFPVSYPIEDGRNGCLIKLIDNFYAVHCTYLLSGVPLSILLKDLKVHSR